MKIDIEPRLISSIIRSVSQAMLYSSRSNRRVLANRCRSGEIVRIIRGSYLPSSVLRSACHQGLLNGQFVVLVARALAAIHRRPYLVLDSRPSLFIYGYTHDFALAPDLCHGKDHSLRPLHFPAVVLDQHVVAAAMSVRPRHCDGRAGLKVVEGLNFLDQESLLIRCVTRAPRHVHLADLFAQINMIFAAIVNFNRFRQGVSRARERSVRENLQLIHASLARNTRNAAKLRSLIPRLDAGCESPGESRLLFILQSARAPQMQTQYEVIAVGRQCFVDIAFPRHKIAYEFDGRQKYGDTVDQVHSVIEDEQDRQRRLEAEGWKVVRLRWSALAEPSLVLRQLSEILLWRAKARKRLRVRSNG